MHSRIFKQFLCSSIKSFTLIAYAYAVTTASATVPEPSGPNTDSYRVICTGILRAASLIDRPFQHRYFQKGQETAQLLFKDVKCWKPYNMGNMLTAFTSINTAPGSRNQVSFELGNQYLLFGDYDTSHRTAVIFPFFPTLKARSDTGSKYIEDLNERISQDGRFQEGTLPVPRSDVITPWK